MGEVFITRKGGGSKSATPTLAVTSVGGSFVQLAVTNNDAISQATIFLLANYDTNSETDFDILAAQSGTVINVGPGTTVSAVVSGLDPDTSHTVSAQAAIIKKLPSTIITTDTINLSGTGIPAPTVGPITANTFTSTTFNVTNNDTVVSLIVKANITTSTTAPTVYPFESSALAALATGSITVSGLTSSTVYYIHARAFDGTFTSSNVVFGPYTQSSPIVATGGTITNYSSGGISYRAHTFTGNGTFAVTSVPTGVTGYDGINYLIIGGGGSGGNGMGGGGGAGGLVHNLNGSLLPITATNYPITIGAGANGPIASSNTKVDGVSTTAFSITGLGGGGASSLQMQRRANIRPGNNGGSGGGSGASDSPGGSGGVATQPSSQWGGFGFNGGNAPGGGVNYPGAGGGGANGVGGTPPNSSSPGAVGGAGLQVNIDNNNYYWAGGGGGNGYSAGNAGNGGIGGGGGGSCDAGRTRGLGGGSALNAGGHGVASASNSGGAGGANTGSGGGGASWDMAKGANGGSGIVIVRYVVGGL